MSSLDVKEQILMASGPIFARLGYEKATVREICAAAHVNVAAVNYYFGDKQQLYVATVKRAYQLRSSQVPMPNWHSDASADEMFNDFVITLVRRMVVLEDAPWETQLLIREVLHPTEACKTLIENYFRPQMELLMSILDRLLPQEVPLSRRRKVAFSVFGQCVFYRVAGEVVAMMLPEAELEDHFTADQLGRHIAETMLQAIKHCPDHWLTDSDQRSAGEKPLAKTTSNSNSHSNK